MDLDLDLQLIWLHLRQIGIAFILALPIAINREHRDEGAGLRTFPLVCIAACAFMQVGISVYEGSNPSLSAISC
jgi:putative Mg2+ transporter-C (MgtC) family protein